MTGTVASGVTLTNSGSLGTRVNLAGGLLSNTSAGTIVAPSGHAIYGLTGSYSTVVNAGQIGNPAYATAIDLLGGGGVTNATSGTIVGFSGIFGGVYRGTGDALTVVNAGNIAGIVGYGVILYDGGSVTNLSGASLSGGEIAVYSGAIGALNLLNDGRLTASGWYTVLASAGGSITNQANGTISGSYGIGAGAEGGSTGAMTVVNAGTISASNARAQGIRLFAGGSVTNQNGGTIAGGGGIYAGHLHGTGAVATVVNSGTIAATQRDGIMLFDGGNVSNLSGGTISGHYGIGGSGGATTVVNAGRIVGAVDAISFASGYANRLVIDPNAVFQGTVDGGSTIGAAAVSTLELSSGTSTGTLEGFGTQFIDFAQVAVDTGAYWTLDPTDTIRSGVTLTNAGTLGGGVTLAGGLLSNANAGTVSASVAVSGLAGTRSTVVNTGLIDSTAVYGRGVDLYGGGGITNQTSGTISGYWAISGGVYRGVSGATGVTVVNYGTITSPDAYGIVLFGGGSVTNRSDGTISGYGGVRGGYVALRVVNDGVISAGHGAGVLLRAGGEITNQSSGTITGYHAIAAGISRGAGGAAATLVNYGSIASADGYGIIFYNGGTITNHSGASIDSETSAIYDSAGGALTVTNEGLIEARLGFAVWGIYGVAGGSVANHAYGTISGYRAVGGAGAALTIVNDGTIAGSSVWGGRGVALYAGGSITNHAGGIISGFIGVTGYNRAEGGSLTVINAGSIVADNPSNNAVQFATGHANVLVVDPNAVFVGTVTGGNTIGASAVSALELAAGSSAGLLSGLGSQFIDFAQMTVDAGASWSLTGTNSLAAGITLTNAGTLTLQDPLSGSATVINDGVMRIGSAEVTVASLTGTGVAVVGGGANLAILGSVAAGEVIVFDSSDSVLTFDPTKFAGVICDFTAGNIINLIGVDDASSAGIVNGNTLEIQRAQHATIDLTLSSDDASTGNVFYVTSGQAVLTDNPDPACFLLGTLIRTDRGEVPVELLSAGDKVVTLSGAARPVRWIGYRTIDPTRHPAPHRVLPICVRANAFADGQPCRDLFLSPDHAVLRDGVLVPVRLLVNGGSIRRDSGHHRITYYHVELETHDILLAENLAAESYLETGNRGLFENGGDPLLLHPDLTNDQARRVAESCVPFADDPETVEPIWRALAQRSEASDLPLTPPPETTSDAALCLVADGRPFAPVSVVLGKHVFVVPAGTTDLRLRSRSAAPSETRPWVSDDRRLGVQLRGLTIRSDTGVVSVPLDHPDFGLGWWAPEWQGPSVLRRWTNGDAIVPTQARGTGFCLLEVDVAATVPYPTPKTANQQPAIRRSA